ncbi:hypothetical protein [Streptomyces sp. NPDC053755]|uniref:hypothetical protein n=1 Tax=Streptomyces sp. NPDC053755 TaxID=3155815 RepID=UPI003447A33C
MNPSSAPEPEPVPDAPAQDDAAVAGLLRQAFTRVAHDVTPSPVPLAAVRRAGRRHRRRRTAALAVLAVLGVVTVTAVTVGRLGPPAAPRVAAAPTAGPAPTATRAVTVPPPVASPVRVVRSGERVDVGKGWTVWLTRQGKHWAGQGGDEDFRSVVDGNIDLSAPGISHQSEGDADGAFHSGLYYGTSQAGRVELTGADGRKTVAQLLELSDRPGWGVWYAHVPPSQDDVGLALYDREGRLLTDLPAVSRDRGAPGGAPGTP